MKDQTQIASQGDVFKQLMKAGDETPIGFLWLYSGQTERLEYACARHAWPARFRKLIRLDTVDAYQGKENLIFIVSLVRANPARIAGHVQSPNRCNVAMSRAKERLIIIGATSMWNALNESSRVRRVLNYVRSTSGRSPIVPVGGI